MIPTLPQLRRRIRSVIETKSLQGYETSEKLSVLESLPDSYDALLSFAEALEALPLRSDWNYEEPDDWGSVLGAMHPSRPRGTFRGISAEDASRRIETAFLSSVCGCVLGKPLETHSSFAEIRAALEKSGDWPLADYVRLETLEALGRRHPSWKQTIRPDIRFVEPDDDMNYTVLGMLLLEQHGLELNHRHLREAWMRHLPLSTTFGPERSLLVKAGIDSLFYGLEERESDSSHWAAFLNPESELCGAQIRADAYGYAFPGRPELAAELAWRDASWTHRKTGVYATMWTAAAIAVAPVAKSPLEIFEMANMFVPQKSRFHETMSKALEMVGNSKDWLKAYESLRLWLGGYGHCQIYFESATLMNSLHHAENIGDGFCRQVMQGNDTDSYGATSGSLLGAYFGPGHLDSRWLEPFHDDIHTALCWFFERSLGKLAQRMGALPARFGP